MKTKILAVALLAVPMLAYGQAWLGDLGTILKSKRDYEQEVSRFEQEKEMRRLQIERLRSGQAEDPVVARQLRQSDERRAEIEAEDRRQKKAAAAANECQFTTAMVNGTPMFCTVCGDHQTCNY